MSLRPTKAARSREELQPNPKLKLLDQCRQVLRFRQMSPRTAQTYCDWIVRFLRWARDTGGRVQSSKFKVQGSGEGTLNVQRSTFNVERQSGVASDLPPQSKVWRHPRDMGEAEVRGFLTHLAAERNVAASTQNQAMSALLFLYREVLGVRLGWVEGFAPALVRVAR